MLETLRNSATGWVAKIFIGLLVISFAIWGIADIFRGFGERTVAKIGETEIPSELFRVAYNNQLRDLGARMRRPLTTQEAVAVGLPNQVLSRLVNEAILDEEARKLKLGLSDEALASEIRSDPNLRGLDGTFDRDRFREILYNNGVSEDFYTVQRRRQNMRAQLSAAVAGGVKTPTAYLEAFNQYQNETRIIRYITLDTASAGTITQPSSDELAKYFESKKADFRAPEYRKFIYIAVDPTSLAKPEDVSEDDIEAAYEIAGSKYITLEKRFVRQIVFPSAIEANTALQKIRGGASFDSILTKRNLSAADVDLGLITKSEVVDSTVADVAFALEKNAVSEVIAGRFGSIIVQVTDIQAEKRTPLEEVRDKIAQDIAIKLAENDVLQTHDEIEDARAGGTTISEIVGRFKLDAKTIAAIDQSAKAPDGSAIELPEAQQLLKAVFESDVGVENDPLQQARGFIWYDVLDVKPARDRTLEEAADMALAKWSIDERDNRLGKKSKELTDRLAKGETLDDVAQTQSIEIKTSPELKRNAPAEGIAPATVSAAFNGPEGYVTSVKNSNGSRVILEVKDVVPPVFFVEAEDVTQMNQQLTAQLTNTVLSQYVAKLRDIVGVEINQTSVARAIGLSDYQ